MSHHTPLPLRILGAVAVFVSWTAPAVAQPTGAITFEFPAQTTTTAEDATETVGIISGSGSIEHWFAQDQGRIFYELSMDRFRTSEAWDTWLHNAGVVRTFTIAGTTLTGGGAAFWRANSGGWADAGFHGLNLQTTVERTLSPATLSAGYNFYVRNFSDAPALNQVEQSVHARALLNLPVRTTLVGLVGGGWKHYDGDFTLMTEGLTNGINPQEGRGRGSMLLRTATRRISEPANRSLWTWTARIAQSLDDRTGIWIEHERRMTGGDAPPALVWTPPLFYDDGVYDDPYAIEARAWRAGARHVFARGDEIAVRLDRGVRHFDGLSVMGSEGLAIGGRADTLWRRGVDAEIVLRSTRELDLILVAGYTHVRNSSNDASETYRSQVVSAGLSIRF